MFKPSTIRDMVTPAKHYKMIDEVVNGRTKKTKQLDGSVRGKFKLKGTTEVTQNGLVVVNDKTSFITWYKPSYESSDILEIYGIDYEIIGTPENTEMRGRYSVINLERIGGNS